MIAILLASTLLLAAGGDPCAAVEPAPVADATAAAVYRAVGDDERAAGTIDTAILAYRTAVSLDPEDKAARAALAELCVQRGAPGDRFQRGLALLEAGDTTGAIAAFDATRAAGADTSAALLEGIAQYERGELEAARPLFQEAMADPAHRDAASFYLGLIALQQGAGPEAAALLDAAASNPGFAPAAADLARLARREGKLVLSVLGEAGWDSNAALAQSGTPVSSSSDGAGALTFGALYRPNGDSGPYLRGLGSYRKQARFGEIDLGGASLAAGWQHRKAGKGLLGEYEYDYRALGSASYLSAHRLLAAGWLALGDVTFGVSALGQQQSYLASLYVPFNGLYLRGEASARMAVGDGWLEIAYRAARDGAKQEDLRWFEHGPRAALRWPLSLKARLGLDAAFTLRSYAAVGSALGLKRSDVYVDGAAFVEWDLDQRWSMRGALVGRVASSNAASFSYTSLAPTLGLAWVNAL